MKLSIFQLILIVVFGFFILIAVGGFSLGWFGPSKKKTEITGHVTVWGTLPFKAMDTLIQAGLGKNGSLTVAYTQKKENAFGQDLLEALANGNGPDLILLPEDRILSYEKRLAPITQDIRSFRDNFIDEGNLYVTPDGVLAYPMVVDPLVMYWNKDLFSSAGMVLPPKTWDEFYDLARKLSKYDPITKVVTQSAVAMGEYRNIANAKNILAALFLQTGNPIVAWGAAGNNMAGSTLTKGSDKQNAAISSALSYYTQFADSSNSAVYSWNRSLPSAQDQFIAGKLGVYFGFASELQTIAQRNPHLNFDVAVLPQVKDSAQKATFARMYGISLLKSSRQPALARQVISLIMGALTKTDVLTAQFDYVPAQRTLVANKPVGNPYVSVFYDSAILSKAWLDPDPNGSNDTFQNMIETALSDPRRVNQALTTADAELDHLAELDQQ